jgi:hypothetical protein
MWLKSQVFWVMPEQVLLPVLPVLPGQPPFVALDRSPIGCVWDLGMVG